MQVADRKTSFVDGFIMSDEVLRQGVQGISDLIAIPGLINLDFADVKSIMSDTGMAHMGIGRASGENRAEEAAKAAINSPLLESSIEGARGVLLSITAGPDLAICEVTTAAELVQKSIDADANIIFGAVIDEKMGDEMSVTVIATGFDKDRVPLSAVAVDRLLDKSVFDKNSIPEVKPQAANPNDLDVPTFLRKRNKIIDTNNF